MAKSFKRVIASLLAVLMIAFSMPFTALANGGDYKADVRLQFSPVYISGYFDYDEALAADSLFDYTMLQEAPLTYNYTMPDDITVSGTLTLEAAKTVPICNSVGVAPLAEDRTLGVGDYFAVTVVMDGVTKLAASQVFLSYSANIEPAGLYSRTASRKNYSGLAGISDANGSKITVGGTSAVASNSAEGLVTGIDDGAVGNGSSIDTNKRVIKSVNSCQNGKYASTAATIPDGTTLTNPETGELGYTYSDRYIANTFIFKIIGAGNIDFSVYDPDNTKEIAYSGFYFLDDGNDIRNANYNTYADYTTDSQACPGEHGMLFYGKNINSGEGCGATECTHANTETRNAVAATCGKDGYTGDVVCLDCDATVSTGSVIPKTNNHNYIANVTQQPTCTVPGKTTYTCDVCGDSYVADAPAASGHKEAAAVEENRVESTCTVAGHYDSVVYCEVCGEELSRETKSLPLADHTPAAAVEENRVEPTEDAAGSYDSVVYCSVCHAEISRTQQTIPALGHTHSYTSSYTDPTCTENGYTTYTCVKGDDSYVVYDDPATTLGHTEAAAVEENRVESTCSVAGHYDSVVYCSVCHAELSRETKSLPLAKHTEAAAVEENRVESTCSVAGHYDSVVYCSVCHAEISRETKALPLANHTPDAAVEENRVESTCKVAGSYDSVVYCSVCHAEISRETKALPLANHTPAAAVEENRVEPTKSKDGSYDEVVYCSVCNEELSRTTKVIPATGVTVTINNTFENYGDVTPTYGAHNYKYGATVRLSAQPVEGATFVGWSISNKIVSTSANYSFTAYVDTEITPVFNDAVAAETITVVFLDMYKNITAAFEGITVADFQAAMAAAIPTPTDYPGYVFTGWSMTDDEIKNLAESATITSSYDVREIAGFTVTATGAQITVSGTTTSDVATGVAYDAQATVTAAGAKAWKIGDAVVAYGDTYSFYVGSDVTLTAVYDAVDETPTVTIISTELSGASDYKVAFLATTSVPSGYTMIDRGFVYGKAADASELTLENVGNRIAASGAVVKAVSAGASASCEQYGLTYGIKAKNAAAVAVAYVTVKAADGTITTVYSDASVYNY